MEEKQIAEKIDSLTLQLEKLKENAFPEHARERLRDGLCLSCGNKLKTKPIRGCDANCYRNIKRDLDTGRYTEGQAITAGLLSPEQKSGRKATPKGIRGKLISGTPESQVSSSSFDKNDSKDIDSENLTPIGRKRRTAKKQVSRSDEKRKHG